MMSNSTEHETASTPTASQEPLTGRARTAWATGRDDESQSATFRALAWSQDDDSVAEYLPYIGEDFTASELDSRQTVQFAENAAGSVSAPRNSRSALLYGIVAGFAAAAVGGLLLTVVNADITPTTTSPMVIQPAKNAVMSQPDAESGHQDVPVRPFASAPINAVASSARPVAPAVTPAPNAPVLPPASQKPSAPEAAAPEVTVPAVPAPEFATPLVKPPVWVAPPELPPAITAPIVSVPEVTPQPVLHPVGPIVLHVPTTSDPIHLPTPSGPIHVPTVSDPAAPAASNPVISLKPGVTIPVVIPTLSTGAGQ